MILNRKKNLSRISLTLVLSLALSGCAGNTSFAGRGQEKRDETGYMAETLGLTPDFSYERKAEKPNIQVDRQGYLPKSAKVAIFQEEELPERFQVIDRDSGECVYEGEVRSLRETEEGAFVGYGNFSDVEKEGNYYIQSDRIGCSCYFVIGKDVYLETARKYGSIIETGTPTETLEICETISSLLTAYEMYPDLILQIWESGIEANETPDGGGEFFRMLRRETDLLLSLQDERTGGIYGEVEMSREKEEGQEMRGEAAAAFAGTMAKYSYLYQQYDWDYANTCLKAAAKAWRYSEGLQGAYVQSEDEEKGGTGEKFYAAAELYRASNEIIYHNYILQNQEVLLDSEEDFYGLMAKVTYLSTRRDVDQELCGELMEELMEEAKHIAEASKDGLFLVKNKKTSDILWDMTVMALANYAIMNYEYVTVIENNVHYLMGRNEETEILLQDPGSRDAARLLLLLSVVETERRIIDDSETEEN